MIRAWAFGPLALLGAALGSFGNVVVSRLPRRQSLIGPSSRCPHCKTPIKPWHNIPIFSWFWLKGRCARCRWRIPWRYPALEIGISVLAGFFTLSPLPPGQALAAFVLSYGLILLSLIDLEFYLLPDSITYSLALGGLLAGALGCGLGGEGGLGLSFEGLGLCGLIFLVLGGIKRDGMGMGDIKLAAALGAWFGPGLGWQTLLIGVVFGGLAASFFLLTGRKGPKDRIPFGPFLGAGALVEILLKI